MPNRRTFLRAAAGAATLTSLPAVHAAGDETLRLGLVGCGGRGNGAARDALKADPQTKLVAVCDIFPEIAQAARDAFSKSWQERAPIGERVYSGFDGYKQLIDDGDVDVILFGTPPGFRPMQIAYAIEAGKHVFAEKPMAVDAPGVRSVLATAKLAQQKNLLCASGFCYRHEEPKIELMNRLRDGAIGRIHTMQSAYNTGLLWHNGDQPEWSPMEKQIRNWYYYPWLSGDHIVEQACHNIDKICWAMNDYPIAATGLGGRQMRTAPKWGTIWDHFSIIYEYADGRRSFLQCRQMANCKNDISDHLWGTDGRAVILEGRSDGSSHRIMRWDGSTIWQGPTQFPDRYIEEQRVFLASIRAGKPFNDMESAAHSTLMAILGREAAYTGQRLTWNQMLQSKRSLVPTEFAWGEHDVPPVAVPGVTKFT